ncbi:hypothetical protein NG799_22445 [Laspinema sp. D1]|uniref:Uncharacterized protein n=1 Tax=Laspinema palackyanum D2a TaxID=2953684 RepID=A0ABT2MX37_9CYAN|nr:hypothetical protein [Laspinema sp. D2a]
MTPEHSVEPMQKLRLGSKRKIIWGHRPGFYYILSFLLSLWMRLMLWIMSGKLPPVAESFVTRVSDGSAAIATPVATAEKLGPPQSVMPVFSCCI